MALAFKRAVAEAQKAVDSANESIKGWYSPPVNPALIVDFEGIKAVAGESTQNSNSENLPKNITCVNWVKDNASYFHSVWGDIQYKDKERALPIAIKHLDKVVVHVDDKSPAGAYNTYDVEFKGKDLHITVHLDFTNYPQQLSLTDDKSHIDRRVIKHLDTVCNFTYELRKATAIGYESSQLNTYQKYMDEKLKKKFPIVVNWDSVLALAGESQEYSNYPPVPNNARGVYFLEDGRGFYNVYYAIETLVADELGLSAFLDTFDKVEVALSSGSTDTYSGPHTITKDGKTLKINYKLNLEDLTNARADYSAMAKQIEALL